MRAAIIDKPVVFALGCAGTGKSLCATYTALELLDRGVKNGGVERIVVTRPLVTAGEEFGHLPGDLGDKVDPYMRPIIALLEDSNHPRLQTLLDGGKGIETVPVALIRGLTFHDAIVLVDEAQNLRREQIKMILTRLGRNAKIILTGDTTQTDLKNGGSGLAEAAAMFKDDPAVEVITFGIDDILRHDFVGRVIQRYAEQDAKPVPSKVTRK
jgi:phosphate starvation-inducible PhoH-like protein